MRKLSILLLIGVILSVILASCQPPTDGVTNIVVTTPAPPPAEGEGDGITVISDNIYRFRYGLDVCFVYIGVGISCTYHN